MSEEVLNVFGDKPEFKSLSPIDEPESLALRKLKESAYGPLHAGVASFFSGFSENFTSGIARQLIGFGINLGGSFGGDEIVSPEVAKKEYGLSVNSPVYEGVFELCWDF